MGDIMSPWDETKYILFFISIFIFWFAVPSFDIWIIGAIDWAKACNIQSIHTFDAECISIRHWMMDGICEQSENVLVVSAITANFRCLKFISFMCALRKFMNNPLGLNNIKWGWSPWSSRMLKALLQCKLQTLDATSKIVGSNTARAHRIVCRRPENFVSN